MESEHPGSFEEEERREPREFTPSVAERACAQAITQLLQAPWVLLTVHDEGEPDAFGVRLHIGNGVPDVETAVALLRKTLVDIAGEVEQEDAPEPTHAPEVIVTNGPAKVAIQSTEDGEWHRPFCSDHGGFTSDRPGFPTMADAVNEAQVHLLIHH